MLAVGAVGGPMEYPFMCHCSKGFQAEYIYIYTYIQNILWFSLTQYLISTPYIYRQRNNIRDIEYFKNLTKYMYLLLFPRFGQKDFWRGWEKTISKGNQTINCQYTGTIWLSYNGEVLPRTLKEEIEAHTAICKCKNLTQPESHWCYMFPYVSSVYVTNCKDQFNTLDVDCQK